MFQYSVAVAARTIDDTLGRLSQRVPVKVSPSPSPSTSPAPAPAPAAAAAAAPTLSFAPSLVPFFCF